MKCTDAVGEGEELRVSWGLWLPGDPSLFLETMALPNIQPPHLDNLPQWQGQPNSPPWFLCRLCLHHQSSTSPQVPSTNSNPPLRTQSSANSPKKQKGAITQSSIDSDSSVLLHSLYCLCDYTSHILLSLNNHKSPTFGMLCVLAGSISSTQQSHEALWLCGLSFHRTEAGKWVACSRPYNQCLKYRWILGTHWSVWWPITRSPGVRGDGLNREVIVAPPCQNQWCIVVTAAWLQRCADYMPLNSRIYKEIRGHRYCLLLHRDLLVKARYL